MKLYLAQTTPNYESLTNGQTNDNTNYTFMENYIVGISILPEYYQILCSFSNDDVNAFLKYLYCKFHKKILLMKIAPLKRTATATYQPPTQQYKNVKLKNISPYVWEKYWDLRRMTGYSISYIIRLFIEWELESGEKQEQEEINQVKKECQSRINLCQHSNFHFENNYELIKGGSSVRNDITIDFKDKFY